MPADVLEVPVEISGWEVIGYALKIECKVGDQVMTFDHVVTFKEVEDREKAEQEVRKLSDKARLLARAKP